MAQVLAPYGWFLIADNYHRGQMIHFVDEGQQRSTCGRIDLTPQNLENIVRFKTIEAMPVKDICKVCLRKKL